MVLNSAGSYWTSFCWIAGFSYALSSILIAFVCVVGVIMWHGPSAAVWDAQLRYLTISLVALIVMTAATSTACFAARHPQRLTAGWVGLHIAAVTSSFVAVLSLAAYCWTIAAVSKKVEIPIVFVLSVWIIEPLLWYRHYREYGVVPPKDPVQ